MGTGTVEDLLLKGLGTAGALGLFAYLVIVAIKALGVLLDKHQQASADKDKVFAAALDKLGTDMKAVSSEMRDAIDSVKTTIVEMDRGHTAQNNQTFQLLISLNDKQGSVIGIVVQKVDHLDQTVRSLVDKQDEHGQKLDAIGRVLPAVTTGTTTRRTATQVTEQSDTRSAGQVEGQAG